MDPETNAFLVKSREFLSRSESILKLWPDEAGRFAYLGAFHAAQALIFHRTASITKTHKGVHAKFHLLTKDDAAFDEELRAFLGRGFNLKTAADYGVGPEPVTEDRAARAITQSRRFVDHVEGLIRSPKASAPPTH